ncbi:hypothetical protein G7046_g2710 [Stylonectria norvegica]|nr:hypothetical protein G7046_g2710 [Stylonectria norvegica]
MPNDEMLTDDYVAGLLSQEAKDCSLKYSTVGMEAYRSDKKPANSLKPNTRFLRNIIKDTDAHNKALLAKEAAESRARLQDLEKSEEAKRRKTNPNTRDIRSRQMGDIHAILGGKKRRKPEGEETPSVAVQEPKVRDAPRKRELDEDLIRDRLAARKQHGRLTRDEDGRSKSDDRPHRDERRRARPRGKDDDAEENRESRHSRSRRHRSRSPGRRRRSRSPRERSTRHRHRSPLQAAKDKDISKKRGNEDGNDSDPLDDLIGPAPPPQYRGRGTFGGSSSIDRRFSDTYDPKADVQMDDTEVVGTGWDDALEAFRDRQKLKQNQEQRLKAAGFADDQILRASAFNAPAEEDVRWSKAGEKREWDRGKVEGLDRVLTEDEL